MTKTTATIADYRQRGLDLVPEITAAGIPAKVYAKPPAGKENFIMSIGPAANEFRFWPGAAEMKIHVNTSLGQMVLNVHEPERVLSCVATIHGTDSYRLFSHWDLKRYSNIRLPEEAIIVSSEEVKSVANGELGWRSQYIHTCKFEAKIPETRMSFLIGYDEDSMFISQLPEDNVSSVKKAHELLLPESLRGRKDLKRHGEFFFAPVDDERNDYLNELMRKHAASHMDVAGHLETYTYRSFMPLEAGSTHLATTLYHLENKRYAIGLIVDRRPNRHGPLVLDRWHEVVRNAEVKNDSWSNPGYWD